MEEFYTIGQKIKAARRAIGYTQKDLAKRTGYTESGISRIENGEIDLGVSKVKIFADVLRVPVDYIVGDYFAEVHETPEEMFNRLDDNVRHGHLWRICSCRKRRHGEKFSDGEHRPGRKIEIKKTTTVRHLKTVAYKRRSGRLGIQLYLLFYQNCPKVVHRKRKTH